MWKPFEISRLFDIYPGKRLVKDNMTDGDIPFVGASDSNNGVTIFCGDSNNSMDANVLGVNYNGSVCESFYHPYKALFSDDVKRFHLKDIQNNKYVALFLKSCILQQKGKFEYGYKFNGERMSKTIIYLPVTNEEQPDYAYMEHYMQNEEHKMLVQYINFKLK